MEEWRNELNENAISGSELMMIELEEQMEPGFLDDFQIILSRPRQLKEDKIRILWCHDLENDPESVRALTNGRWENFHRIVFVSNWQQQRYIDAYNIPWHRTVVLKNAIPEIDTDVSKKFKDFSKDDQINLIYHTTPHRGLALLVPVFEELQKYVDNIHLDVYSSFKIYGWEERDKSFGPLYDRCKSNPSITYHGTVDNKTVHEALDKAHIFAYPSIWTETSCRALIEAMSAGCICIHPNNGALFETGANWTYMYPFDERNDKHAVAHLEMLIHACNLLRDPVGRDQLYTKLTTQRTLTNICYSWMTRKEEWKAFLDSLRNLDRALPTENGSTFSYKV